MRLFTEADKDNLFWWSPAECRLPPPAREKTGDYRSPLRRLLTDFSRGSAALLPCAVRDPKTRAFLLDRGMRCPEAYSDPARPLPTITGRLSYGVWAHARSCSAPAMFGLTIAEVCGVPARLLRLSGRDSLFKYKGYYQSTGCFESRYACSVDGGRELQGKPPLCFESQALWDAFSRNLWMEE